LNYYHGNQLFTCEVANGWTISPIINIHNGFLFTVLGGKDANLTGNSAAERGELVPGQNPVLSNRTAAEWFNTVAFSLNPAVNGISVNGNSGRNMLRGPTFKDADLATSRDFVFKEHLNLLLRADTYNVFNLVSLSTPAGNSIQRGRAGFLATIKHADREECRSGTSGGRVHAFGSRELDELASA
jgi:hypothetical protein